MLASTRRLGMSALGLFVVAVVWVNTLQHHRLAAQDVPAGDPAKSEDSAERLFAVEVLPLLRAKCFPCHGDDPEELEGGLDLRSREGLLQGGESEEPAIVPNAPDDSLLMMAIRWDGLEMPPKENDRLTPEQIKAVERWIAAGAPWPDDATLERLRRDAWSEESPDGVRVPTSGGTSEDWTNRLYDPENIWAFQPLGNPAVPPGWAHPVDAFVGNRLAEAGLEPAPQADPVTLIRRAMFDLHGLPPTPREIETFVREWENDADIAWKLLIDRLLESPRYGERWAQHWLDVVRYADTAGFSNDWERSNAWRYRDYVIRSLNEDVPYDQFIIEQLAGDEVNADDPEMLVATGFLRMGAWEHTPMSPDEVSRQQYLDDLVNGIGQTFLSTTMRCCKCHDHKFDPIPTRDYYRIYAAVATTQPAERPAPFLTEESRAAFERNRQHVETLLEFATQEQNRLYAKREEAARRWYAERGREDEYVPFAERLRLPGDDKPPRFVGLTTAEQGELKVREQDVRIWSRCLERFQPLAQSVYNGGNLYQQSRRLRMPQSARDQERAQVLPEIFILSGGSLSSPSDPVTPGVLSGLQLPVDTAVDVSFEPSGEGEALSDPYALPAGMAGRRLALARWIARPDNPLTTRSIVNRVWHYHFGRGLASNPNNFGTTGGDPTHPALLDYLAVDFVENGWSLKHLHRQIMTSETYRRSTRHQAPDLLTERDPTNDLWAVFEPRRLTAEELRDAMLAVSGELNLDMGGLPIRPEINMEIALAPRMIQFSLAPAYQPSRTPYERNRRSIYAYRIRGLADPMMEVFNKPGADESCERRDSPAIVPQAFTLMNSRVATQRSIALAARLTSECDTPEDRIVRGYELAYGRRPGSDILNRLLEHHANMVEYHREHSPDRVVYPKQITRSLVEEFSGDAFEYVEKLDIYEDYVPDLRAADVSAETRALADICLLIFNSNEFIYVY